MKTLVDHAKEELEKAHVAPDTIDWYLTVVHAFSSYRNTDHDGTLVDAIPTIMTLLERKNLTPLTNDPKEWTHIPDDNVQSRVRKVALWQNNRLAEAFSHNGGDTYFLLSEGGSRENPYPQHKSAEYRTVR